MSNFANILKALKTKLQDIEGQECVRLSEIHKELSEKASFATLIDNLWIGGWGREDYNHYTDPNNRNRAIEVNPEYFYDLLEKTENIDIYEIEEEIADQLGPLKKFQKELVTDLSLIYNNEKLSAEIELLNSIEKFEWGFEINDYISVRRPNNIVVYDRDILSNGLPTPPHIHATGFIVSLTTKAFSSKKFIELSTRIIRQIELKLNIQGWSDASEYNDHILANIFDNFHGFYKQLKNRHADRPTIEIVDEYDVQDLLHAILKLHFRDVREEEYTPSYAGSSTRMDFLLKNEKIVIEVKKTRDKLKDKEIGEQLILDIAHYKNHPDCRILKCFVYDPDSRVKNPKGLEDDINKFSNDELQVELVIRP